MNRSVFSLQARFDFALFTRRWLAATSMFTIGLTMNGCKQDERSSTPIPPSAVEQESLDLASIAIADNRRDDSTPVPDRSIPVPDGDAEQLFSFIDRLDGELETDVSADDSNERTENAWDAARAAVLRRVMEAQFEACHKILDQDVAEDTRIRAIRIQLNAMRTLVALDPQEITERFDEYTQRIATGHNPLLARMAKSTRYQALVNESLYDDGPSSNRLMTELQTLLSDPDAGPETLNATRESAGWLLQFGKTDAAIESFRMIGQRFEEHEDAVLAGEAESLSNQAINLDLARLARRVVQQQPDSLDQLLLKLQELLGGENKSASVLAGAMQAAQLIEFSGHPRQALLAYKLIQDTYQDGSDTGLTNDIRRSVELADRRLNLIGQPLRIEGVRLNGDAFDWDQYRGKWVVVCFWTTWHEHWLDEVANIRKSVAAFDDPAVEVVAISLDDDRNLLERFLKDHPTHWPVVVDPDPAAAGFENSNAIRCGVEAVPFIILVNPQGKVADIHLMGERLPAGLSAHVQP